MFLHYLCSFLGALTCITRIAFKTNKHQQNKTNDCTLHQKVGLNYASNPSGGLRQSGSSPPDPRRIALTSSGVTRSIRLSSRGINPGLWGCIDRLHCSGRAAYDAAAKGWYGKVSIVGGSHCAFFMPFILACLKRTDIYF